MKARPIHFSAPMIRALLEGRKTQTRRVVKPQPTNPNIKLHAVTIDGEAATRIAFNDNAISSIRCPYGKPGDLLWVRESRCETNRVGAIRRDLHYVPNWVEFKADCGIMRYPVGGNFATRESDFKWKPSLHMPRWASRLTLELTEVRVERLQDISEADAYAEGVTIPSHHAFASNGNPELRNEARVAYQQLWESINGPGSWEANPWVWVLTFCVHKQNIDDFIKSREAA